MRRPPRRTTRAVPLLLAAALLAACTAKGQAEPTTGDGTRPLPPFATTTTPSTTTPGSSTSTLDWTDCDGGYQCAELEVPVDHTKPDGDTLTLALAKRVATDPSRRIGSLLMNPGGPGASAIDLIENIPLPRELTSRFDIVGFDPRGVGRSSPLDCRDNLQAMYDADPTLDSPTDRTRYLEESQAFVDGCEAKYGDLLPHLGTVDVAKDMDAVRAALGEESISYVGYSYGTAIGQEYARLFPERVRAMVIDGVVDVTQTGIESAEGQAKGFEEALASFVDSCDQDGCGIDGSALDAVDAVRAASEAAPIPARRGDRPATPGVVDLALAQALYSPSLWPQLGDALAEALDGNGDGMTELADLYLGREDDGSYDNGFEIYFAVECLDQAWPRDPGTVLAEGKRVGAKYPHVGEALTNDYVRCALWPTPAQPLQPVPTDQEGLAPIVVISTTGDPATPYQDGVDVAEQIPGAVLISYDGVQHTVFAQGVSCVDDPVVAYLIDGTVPTDGLRC